MMPSGNLMHFARLSIGAALATIALMLAAYLVTDSVGLLSDALESLVNLAAAFASSNAGLNRIQQLRKEAARTITQSAFSTAEPSPLAVFDRFADSSLNFTLLCWTGIEDFIRVRCELTIAVNNAFKEAGIQIRSRSEICTFTGPTAAQLLRPHLSRQ